MNIGSAIAVIVVGLGAILFVTFLLAYPLMLLWNGCLVDAITIAKPVGWLQMWGIAFLFGCLFKTSVTSK